MGGDAAAPASSGDSARLVDYELLICVCGGIAAYKTAEVVSALVQEGCGVSVAMTRNATRFVGEITFQALSGRTVFGAPWKTGIQADIAHLKLSQTADLILVAPATANMLGKLANGMADDGVSSLLIGADCPVVLAPAMNARMWKHPAVVRNATFLREAGFVLVGPGAGWLACREIGPGRMSEPEELIAAVREQLLSRAPKRRGER